MPFDTMWSRGGFYFSSAEFPQGNVAAAVGWAERRGVAHLVRSVGKTGALAVLRSRRTFATWEQAERACVEFCNLVSCRREDGAGSAEVS